MKKNTTPQKRSEALHHNHKDKKNNTKRIADYIHFPEFAGISLLNT